MNISERTITRWHNNAVVSGGFYLEKEGYNFNKLLEMLKNEKWILQTYQSFSQKSQTKKNIKKAHMFQNACKEYKKILCK